MRVGEWERGRERDREKKTLGGEGGGGRVIRSAAREHWQSEREGHTGQERKRREEKGKDR